MESLLRTRVGRFRLEESLRLADVEDRAKNGDLSQILLPLDSVFSELRQVILKDEAVSLGYNGNPFYRRHVVQQPCRTGSADGGGEPASGPEDGERFRIYDGAHRFIAMKESMDSSGSRRCSWIRTRW